MAAVHLIPGDMHHGIIRKHRMRMWLIVCPLILSLMLVWSGWVYWNYQKASKQVNLLNQEFEKTMTDIESLKKARGELDQWKGRIALMEELSHYPDLAKIGRELTSLTPEMIYYDRLEISPPSTESDKPQLDHPISPPGMEMFRVKQSASNAAPPLAADNKLERMRVLLLQGYAPNHQQLAQLIEALTQCELFRLVELQQSQRKAGTAGSQVVFEIQCFLDFIPQKRELNYADLHTTENL